MSATNKTMDQSYKQQMAISIWNNVFPPEIFSAKKRKNTCLISADMEHAV